MERSSGLREAARLLQALFCVQYWLLSSIWALKNGA
ncbi:MAG: hypothetical protein QOH83_1258 [Solirubrobacteraceae bacterium]|nr:hypothetical protein [Solirubrobacteraceae bacterium]